MHVDNYIASPRSRTAGKKDMQTENLEKYCRITLQTHCSNLHSPLRVKLGLASYPVTGITLELDSMYLPLRKLQTRTEREKSAAQSYDFHTESSTGSCTCEKNSKLCYKSNSKRQHVLQQVWRQNMALNSRLHRRRSEQWVLSVIFSF